MLFHPTHTRNADGDQLDTHAPPYIPGPYAYSEPQPATRVPSLVSLCIRVLVPFPEQVHQLPVRLILRPHQARALIDTLVPDPAIVDPRLWATLVQVYDSLPRSFASYTIPLADTHLPLLQSIPSSASFSLVTVLELSACEHLTDDTVLQLKFLHTLTAFDASETALTVYGIKTLAATLQFDESDDANRGPWQLRVLSLRGCSSVNDHVFSSVDKFPLLSVLDLRGTRCTPNSSTTFRPCDDDDLYHPTPIKDALTTVQSSHQKFYSSSNPYTIHINTLYHRPTHHAPKAPTVAPQDAFVVIPSDNSRVKVGITHIIERQIQARDDEIKHARNKEAWYDRQERLESRGWPMDEQSEFLRQKAASDLASFISAPPSHKHSSSRISSVASVGPTSRASGSSTIPPQPSRGFSTSASAGPSFSNRNLIPNTPKHPTMNSPVSSLTNHNTIPAQRIPSATPRGDATALTRAAQSDVGGMSNALTRIGAAGALPVSTRHCVNEHERLPGSTTPETRPPTGARAPLPQTAAPASFYQTLPKPPSHPSKRARPSSEWTQQPGRHDASLRLFRPPPPFNHLAATLAGQRAAQREARQHREWQRAAAQGEELAKVDMRSGKAEGMRRLQESARREVERRRAVSASVGGWTPSVFTSVPSRNPFRKRPSLPVSLPSFASASSSPVSQAGFKVPHPPTGSSSVHASSGSKRAPPSESLTSRDENRSRITPRASSGTRDGTGAGAGDPSHTRSGVDVDTDKALKPISAVQVPVLSADLRKEALAKEKAAEKSLKRASSSGSLGGGCAAKKAKVKTKENEKAFDWKGWSKAK